MHRFDALIVLALLIAIVYFVQSHWRNRLRATSEAAASAAAANAEAAANIAD